MHAKSECSRIENVEMDVVNLRDKIRNERHWEHLGVVPIGDELRDLFKMVWT